MTIFDQPYVWMIGFIIFATGGLVIFNNIARLKEKKYSNELVVMVFGISGTLFSLLLAFVIVSVWEDWQDMNSRVKDEADTISNMYSYTHHLPDSLRDPIRISIREYTRSLIEDEWPEMAGEIESTGAHHAYMELRKNVHRLHDLSGDDRDIFTNEFQLYLTQRGKQGTGSILVSEFDSYVGWLKGEEVSLSGIEEAAKKLGKTPQELAEEWGYPAPERVPPEVLKEIFLTIPVMDEV